MKWGEGQEMLLENVPCLQLPVSDLPAWGSRAEPRVQEAGVYPSSRDRVPALSPAPAWPGVSLGRWTPGMPLRAWLLEITGTGERKVRLRNPALVKGLRGCLRSGGSSWISTPAGLPTSAGSSHLTPPVSVARQPRGGASGLHSDGDVGHRWPEVPQLKQPLSD